MGKKDTELMTAPSQEILEQLKQSYPVEQGYTRKLFPKLSMLSQDKTEGKGKAMKVVAEAGTFYKEYVTDEMDEKGKKIWEKIELGNSISGIIVYRRNQLRYFDESTQLYTSSSLYDSDDEIVKLFCDKKEIAKGTPKDLKAKYQFTDKDGKVKSKLGDSRVLYILYDGEIHEMTIKGSSMFSFFGYQKTVAVMPGVVTKFTSEFNEKGTISWNKMIFEVERQITSEEAEQVAQIITDIKGSILAEKAYYQQNEPTQQVVEEQAEVDKKFKDF